MKEEKTTKISYTYKEMAEIIGVKKIHMTFDEKRMGIINPKESIIFYVEK